MLCINNLKHTVQELNENAPNSPSDELLGEIRTSEDIRSAQVIQL